MSPTRVYPLWTHCSLAGANAYLIKVANGFVLVDTGFVWSWKRLRLVVLTHGDVDHAGNAARLRRGYRAAIAVHRGDLPAVERGVIPRRASVGLLAKAVGLLGRIIVALRRGAFETFVSDLVLEDGQSLDEHGLAAKIIHIPGHTKGSIAILTADGSPYSGDTLFNMKHPPLFVENLDEFKASLAKLRSIQEQVTRVYPGHGKSFPGAAIGRMEV